MAEDKGGSVNAGEAEVKEASASPSADTSPSTARKRKGLIARLWNGIFRHADDLEKRLQHISKEEAAVVARLRKRSISWRRVTRNLIIFSVVLEAIAVGYAIMTTRTLDMDWKMRAFRVLPMFILPALTAAAYSTFISFTKMCYCCGLCNYDNKNIGYGLENEGAAAYSTFISFTKMCDRKDQKTLERLRAERQAKIDELKERTNYYTTQQLIQEKRSYECEKLQKQLA